MIKSVFSAMDSNSASDRIGSWGNFFNFVRMWLVLMYVLQFEIFFVFFPHMLSYSKSKYQLYGSDPKFPEAKFIGQYCPIVLGILLYKIIAKF